jgi:hypothetical protein
MPPLYTSNFANNIRSMYNSEITGLAKNRFTDEETMLAISKHHYRLGKEYLAMNPSITPEAAQELWNHRGYVFKAILLSKGTIKLTDKEYTETYRKYFKNRKRSMWRMQQAFLGSYYWRDDSASSNTPTELLDEIYGDAAEEELERTYTLERFINHPNCSLDLALRIGTTNTPANEQAYGAGSWDRLRDAAMLKVAEITKRESAASR